ncbi:MAG: TonB-dependent receptor [Panacagrimonas sp.]
MVLCGHCPAGFAAGPGGAEPQPLDTIPVDPLPEINAVTPVEPAHAAVRVDEIIVTAQKREENIQNVPISIQAFSGESLTARGIESTRELVTAVPSLLFSSVATLSIVFIRGLGTDNIVPSVDPSIATYIDGIYTPNGAATFNSLANVERVEVLKGPQGTLFGRNATGGAISVVTAEPGDEFTGSLQCQFGNFDARSLRGSVSGPLTSWLTASLSGETSRKDAHYSDLFYETPPDRLDAVRFKLHFHPTDRLSLSLSGYRSKQSGLFFSILKNVDPSPLGRVLGVRPQDDDYIGENDFPAQSYADQKLLYGHLTWRLPWFDLKLLGSDQTLDTHGDLDFDASPVPFAAVSSDHSFTDLQTAELQVLSNPDTGVSDRFEWVAGLYYLRSSGGSDPAYLRLAPGLIPGLGSAAQLPAAVQLGDRLADLFDAFGLESTPLGDGGLTVALRGILDTASRAAYVQGTYAFTDWLDLTLGGRAQRETRTLGTSRTELSNFSGEGVLAFLSYEAQRVHLSNFSPKAVLGLHPFENALVYLSYAVAYKSGTYNLYPLTRPPDYLASEKVSAYELGAKLEFLDGLLRFDGALFDNDIRNLQSGFIGLLTGGLVQFVSVPRARSRGVEIGMSWVPLPGWNPGLQMATNAAYIDATYRDFPNGPGFSESTGLYAPRLDHGSNRLIYTPRFSGTLGAVQRINTARGILEAAVEQYYNTGFFTDPQNSVEEHPFAILNARLGYRHAPSNLEVTLFGQNLLDRRYHAVTGRTDLGEAKSLAAPREYGVRLNWAF